MTFQSDLEDRVRYVAAGIAGKARESLERELQRAAPVGTPNPWQTHEPGQLRDSIAVNVRFDGTAIFTFTAQAPVPYASFTNTGASAHPIIAVNVKVLRFDFPRGGLHPAYFRHTAHPGSEGTRWWDNTLARWSDILEAST